MVYRHVQRRNSRNRHIQQMVRAFRTGAPVPQWWRGLVTFSGGNISMRPITRIGR